MLSVYRIASRVAAAGALALVAGCGSTQHALEDQQAQNTAYLALDFTCSRGEAANAEFAALNAHPEQFAEKCVRVKAFSTGSFLFGDASQIRTEKPGTALPAYWKDAEAESRLRLGPSFVIVVGRVRSCTERAQRAEQAEALRARQAHETPHALALPIPCRSAGFGIFVSEAEIIPTAMD